MKRLLVYDLPTRLFHWIFAGLFLTAFIIGKTIDDESVTFSYHMMAGMTLSFVIVLRIVWGLIGTRYARFSGFALNPKDLISYFSGILKNEKKFWPGHNPASSWAGLVMMLLGLSLGVTGYLMVSQGNKSLEEIHELLAHAFIAVVIMHVLGIALHTFRHKDLIGMSMLDGKKNFVDSSQTIASTKPLIGVAFVVLVLAFGLNLLRNFNPQDRTLNLFGTTLQLGENEGGEGAEKGQVPSESHESEEEEH